MSFQFITDSICHLENITVDCTQLKINYNCLKILNKSSIWSKQYLQNSYKIWGALKSREHEFQYPLMNLKPFENIDNSRMFQNGNCQFSKAIWTCHAKGR